MIMTHVGPVLPAEYLLVVAVATVLASANVLGYTKCSKEAKQSLTNMATNAVRDSMMSGLGRMNPFASSAT